MCIFLNFILSLLSIPSASTPCNTRIQCLLQCSLHDTHQALKNAQPYSHWQFGEFVDRITTHTRLALSVESFTDAHQAQHKAFCFGQKEMMCYVAPSAYIKNPNIAESRIGVAVAVQNGKSVPSFVPQYSLCIKTQWYVSTIVI